MQSYTVKHTLKGKGCPTSRVSDISWCPFQTQSDCCCSHRAAIQRTHKPQSGCWLKTQAAYSSQIQVNSGPLKSLHPTPGSDISCYIIKHAAVKMLKKKWLQRDTGAQPANTTWESTFKHITHIYTYLKNIYLKKKTTLFHSPTEQEITNRKTMRDSICDCCDWRLGSEESAAWPALKTELVSLSLCKRGRERA